MERPAPADRDKVMRQAVALFADWQAEATMAGVAEPAAMFLATATRAGQASLRTVLLKGIDQEGLVFYTNTDSRKGRELRDNPQVALFFHWPKIGRQIGIEGRVDPVSNAEADRYFASRPFRSRVGAWASRQSQPMRGRRDLRWRITWCLARWAVGRTGRPPFWTGFRVKPRFWMFCRDGESDPRIFHIGDGSSAECDADIVDECQLV